MSCNSKTNTDSDQRIFHLAHIILSQYFTDTDFPYLELKMRPKFKY